MEETRPKGGAERTDYNDRDRSFYFERYQVYYDG